MKKKEKLSQMVDYRKGSIVSRTLLDKEAGTITLFAFDVEQGLSTHTAPYDAMVYLIEGKADITIGDDTFILEEGELIIMPAHIPHALRATCQFKMMLVMVKS